MQDLVTGEVTPVAVAGHFFPDLLFVIGGFWNGNVTLLLTYNDDPIIKRDLML